MTTKQRAYLRSLAMELSPVTQIGKEGLTEAFFAGADAALEKRELIKLSVLQTSPVSAKEASESLAERLDCDVVQVIGGRIVLYRRAQKKPKIELPK